MGRWVVQRLREGHPPRESQPAAGWAHPWGRACPFPGTKEEQRRQSHNWGPQFGTDDSEGLQSPWEASGRARSRCYRPKIHVAQQKTFFLFPWIVPEKCVSYSCCITTVQWLDKEKKKKELQSIVRLKFCFNSVKEEVNKLWSDFSWRNSEICSLFGGGWFSSFLVCEALHSALGPRSGGEASSHPAFADVLIRNFNIGPKNWVPFLLKL